MKLLFIIKKIPLFLLFLTVALLIFYLEQSVEKEEKKENQIEEKELVLTPTLEIIDESSNNRPIAIMINNHPQTFPYHAGLQDAFVVYEMKVEGAFTRLLALYHDEKTRRIGSVRSARHYFLDYALEYDAIFAHFGGSPKSYDDLRLLNVDNVDFMARVAYYRDSDLDVAWEHRVFTNINLLEDEIEKMNIKRTGSFNYLNYNVEKVRLYAGSILATDVTVNYAASNVVNYQFEEGYYYRYVNDKPHVDFITEEQYYFKNIVIKEVNDVLLDNRGRRDLQTVGTGKGYFITNGRSKPIKWEKATRTSQSVYTYDDGREVEFNDGNTIFQIVPVNTKISFVNKDI